MRGWVEEDGLYWKSYKKEQRFSKVLRAGPRGPYAWGIRTLYTRVQEWVLGYLAFSAAGGRPEPGPGACRQFNHLLAPRRISRRNCQPFRYELRIRLPPIILCPEKTVHSGLWSTIKSKTYGKFFSSPCQRLSQPVVAFQITLDQKPQKYKCGC